MVWYSISFRIFQFLGIHTVKGFRIVNEAKVDFCFVLFFNSLFYNLYAESYMGQNHRFDHAHGHDTPDDSEVKRSLFDLLSHCPLFIFRLQYG